MRRTHWHGSNIVWPAPLQLTKKIPKKYISRWVPITEALPPERIAVIVSIKEDNFPALAYLRYASGDLDCPFFVCPATASTKLRGIIKEEPDHVLAITHWYSPTQFGALNGWLPEKYQGVEFALGINGCLYFGEIETRPDLLEN